MENFIEITEVKSIHLNQPFFKILNLNLSLYSIYHDEHQSIYMKSENVIIPYFTYPQFNINRVDGIWQRNHHAGKPSRAAAHKGRQAALQWIAQPTHAIPGDENMRYYGNMQWNVLW